MGSPPFLYNDKSRWPKSSNLKINIIENPETSSTSLICKGTHFDIIDRYSSLNQLLRHCSLLIRFRKNCELSKNGKAKIIGEITVNEIEDALKRIVKNVQSVDFALEIYAFSKNRPLPKSSRLTTLCPFLDNDGVLRVGGRLNHSNLTFDQKHPMLLLSSNPFSILVVRCLHLRLLHAGPQSLLYNLLLKFWIINARNLCRKVVYM